MPAKGTINYQYIRVKGNITKDLWVESAEMRPSNPKVLHHGKVWVVPPGSKWMADAIPGKPYEGKETGRNDAMDGNDILGKFNPGLGAQSFDIGGSAKMIPKGSDFIFELHYTDIGRGHFGHFEGGSGVREEQAQHALLSVARHSGGVEHGDPSRRSECRDRGGKHRGRG